MANPAAATTLEALRKEIDAIDDSLHALLVRRAALAREVVKAKAPGANPQKGGVPAIRPAREASILRRLVAKGGLSPLLTSAIWREIISASLQSQTPFHVHVFAEAQPAPLLDLARGHFGALTPSRFYKKTSLVVHACADAPDSFGIVPVPQTEEEGPSWWAQLAPAGQKGPRIVGRLPFVTDGDSDGVSAFVIGAIEQEDSGDDTTFLLLETPSPLSRAKLKGMLQGAGLDGSILAEGGNAKTARDKVLVQVSGFLADSDPRLAALVASSDGAVLRAVTVGGYANPILVERAP
jgi:chorismate mutase/prephenate dehydratase